jgi:sporulation protein YlmC with PRC-barrel domain
MQASKLYGKPVYTNDGYYFDEVSDIILDIQPGRGVVVVGITTPSLKKKMIPYTTIHAIGDIIILKKK